MNDADITGSPFAITAYELHGDFGAPKCLPRLRARLQQHGLKLLLEGIEPKQVRKRYKKPLTRTQNEPNHPPETL